MSVRRIGLTKVESTEYNHLCETPLSNCTKKMVKKYFKLHKKIVKALNERE